MELKEVSIIRYVRRWFRCNKPDAVIAEFAPAADGKQEPEVTLRIPNARVPLRKPPEASHVRQREIADWRRREAERAERLRAERADEVAAAAQNNAVVNAVILASAMDSGQSGTTLDTSSPPSYSGLGGDSGGGGASASYDSGTSDSSSPSSSGSDW